ncbi:hypothetical protein BDW72DRAFT_198290 [Aspergillus terricola var. indicus]
MLPTAFDFNTSTARSPVPQTPGGAQHAYSVYRGATYSTSEPAYHQFSELTVHDLTVNSRDGKFNISTGDFFIGSSLPSQAVKQVRTAANRTDVRFDTTYDFSAPVVLNTGIGGLFAFGPDSTGQWSMPAGRTSGSFFWKCKKVSLDEKRSQTWFDRQWNVGPPPSTLNWTWFQLHINNGKGAQNEIQSIWIYDSDEVGHRQWSTAQPQAGVNVVQAVKSFEPFGQAWTSPHSNSTYKQAWNVVLQDGTSLTIESAHDDQELHTSAFSTYAGFVTVTGSDASGDPFAGYGLVEI